MTPVKRLDTGELEQVASKKLADRLDELPAAGDSSAGD